MKKPSCLRSARIKTQTKDNLYSYVILNEEMFDDYVDVKRSVPSKLVVT